MRIKAKDIKSGDRVVIDGRVITVDLTGPTGERRGTCIIFADGEERGISLPLDQELETAEDASAPSGAAAVSAAPATSPLSRDERVIGYCLENGRRYDITAVQNYGVIFARMTTNGDPRHIASIASRCSQIVASERRNGVDDASLEVHIGDRNISDLPYDEALAAIVAAAGFPEKARFWADVNFDLMESARRERATASAAPTSHPAA